MVRGTPDQGRLPNQHLEFLSCIAAHVKIDAVPRYRGTAASRASEPGHDSTGTIAKANQAARGGGLQIGVEEDPG